MKCLTRHMTEEEQFRRAVEFVYILQSLFILCHDIRKDASDYCIEHID